ncbi:MAG: twin-arginine translocase subunit TatC [Candidatus Omnitrophica bacterium]|nr:twin-arginine translocase subunit TatC [Candidatus Omnitrophota bacterium]
MSVKKSLKGMMKNNNESYQGAIEHLEELRKRIFFMLVGWVILSIAGYIFSERILQFLIKPLTEYQEKPFFIRPVDPFVTVMKISIFAGGFLNLPNVLYQIWLFLSPAVTIREKKTVLAAFYAFPLLFAAGAVFSFYVLVPFGLRVLFGFAGETMKPLISIGSYMSFILVFMGSLGLIFNLPFILCGLASTGVVSSGFLRAKRRYAILIVFIIAAVITPPDVFTQFLIAVPLILLYEISIIIASLIKN